MSIDASNKREYQLVRKLEFLWFLCGNFELLGKLSGALFSW